MLHHKLSKILLASFCVSAVGMGQNKPAFTLADIDNHKWMRSSGAVITNNGKYVAYGIKNQPDVGDVLIVAAINGNWKKEFGHASVTGSAFSNDNKKLIFRTGRDSLCILTLGTNNVKYVDNVQSFQLLRPQTAEWLVCKKTNGELFIDNLSSSKAISFAHVQRYVASHDQSVLAIVQSTKGKTYLLTRYQLGSGAKAIWQGDLPENVIIDYPGNQLAFTTGTGDKRVWYYRNGSSDPELLIDRSQAVTDSSLQISGINNFSKDGSLLFLSLKPQLSTQSTGYTANVNVWTFTDAKLQSQQFAETYDNNSYSAMIDLRTRRFNQIGKPGELVVHGPDEFALVFSFRGGDGEYRWNGQSKKPCYLLSLKNGRRKRLEFYPSVSPAGKYFLYREKGDFIVRSVLDMEEKRNLTKDLPIPIDDSENDIPALTQFGEFTTEPAGWLEGDAGLFIYDKFDIWQLDPSGKLPAINLTSGFGRKNNLIFRISFPNSSSRLIRNNDKLIVSVFNRSTKENGFCIIRPGQQATPELLSMGSYVYDIPSHNHSWSDYFSPVKARNAEIYLVQRMSAKESTNLYWTKDFRSFHRISNIHPERSFNWLSSELIKFKRLDGLPSRGILYKPENFNPDKKYPLIIHFYEQSSDELNKYWMPRPTGDLLNIPWFVSNGYLVFTPDIRYEIGDPLTNAVNTIVAAANMLSSYSFVDAKHIGLQGHSWSSSQTNFVLTRTKLFAAANSSCGGTNNCVSAYNHLTNDVSSMQGFFEDGQGRMGATLWQIPEKYISNSSTFSVDKVATPVLLMYNKKDVTNYYQGVEFFTALRRLHKKAWMLQYDEGLHGVDGKESTDYTKRLLQFFDHYLRKAPMPTWMQESEFTNGKSFANN